MPPRLRKSSGTLSYLVQANPSQLTRRSGAQACAPIRSAADIPVEHDKLGRIRVDKYLRVNGQDGMFAAGDAAAAKVDADHLSVMSCQHARPMGRFAGHNVVAELFDLPMLPLSVDWYVTVLDLGSWGAVYTKGFDRQVVVDRCGCKGHQENDKPPPHLSAAFT